MDLGVAVIIPGLARVPSVAPLGATEDPGSLSGGTQEFPRTEPVHENMPHVSKLSQSGHVWGGGGG